jgi:hypothetical protein
VSRRDFLRFRRTERGQALEVSCRTLFMRCADATAEVAAASDAAADWEPWMGEPPAVINRRSAGEILDAFERDLEQAQILVLREPEWLDNLPGAERVQQMIAAFRARGGTVE